MIRKKVSSIILRHLYTVRQYELAKLSSHKRFNFANNRLFSSSVASTTEQRTSPLAPADNLDLSNYGSVLQPTFSLAAYADESPLLQELIKMGVNLYIIEKNLATAKYLVQLDFEKNVKPYIKFLHQNGVDADELGNFITKNPLIFKEDLDDLEVRINYLKSKDFSQEMIANIITKNPKWLSLPVKLIDAKLGYLQQTFKLSGDQVRKVISQVPKLVNLQKKKLAINTYVLKEELNLDEHSLKKLIVQVPVLLKKDEYELVTTYEYLTKTMKIPQYLILKQPMVLTYRKFLVQERHKFLEKLGRAQYNPLLPGYAPLLDLFTFSDDEFCEKIAKTSIITYNEFLKTL